MREILYPSFRNCIFALKFTQPNLIGHTFFCLNYYSGEKRHTNVCAFSMELVGAAGFEPATSWSQTKRATGLRYAPVYFFLSTDNF